MIDDLLAAAEVAGRFLAGMAPGLRDRLGRFVRRPTTAAEPITLPELQRELDRLGLEPDRDLLVHASWSGMRQLQAKPSELLGALRSIAGARGTLLMPGYPAERWEGGVLVYDVDNAPSRMGLLSESFRRAAGVRRSPCPIAPVLASGPAADLYTRDHREVSGATPWGRGSAWWLLGERGGQELILGVDFVRVLTLMHVAFDTLLDANPIAGYHERIECEIRRGGRSERWMMKRVSRSLETHLATYAFRRKVIASGTVRTSNLRGLQMAVVDARRFLEWHEGVARATGLPYWGFSKSSVGQSSVIGR